MKIEKNNKYYTIGVYVIISVIIIFLIIEFIANFKMIIEYAWQAIKYITHIFKPLIIGIVVAYLIDPFVDFYCRKVGKEKRLIATCFAVITLVAFIGIFVLMAVMNIQEVVQEANLNDLLSDIQAYLLYFQDVVEQMTITINGETFSKLPQRIFYEIYQAIDGWIIKLSNNLINFITVLGTNIVSIALGFIIAMYILKDKPKLLTITKNILSVIFNNKISTELIHIAADINMVLSGYIRGQIIDTVIVATLTSLLLTIVGVDFAIIIGIIVGIFNLIPYFGPIIGAGIAGVIGIMGGDMQKGLYAIIAVFVLQQIEAFIIVPKVIGENVKLHPISVLLAVGIGGEFCGLFGMLLGVPIVALLRVIIIRYVGDIFSEDYKKKPNI
ncbi:hypothetical protein AN639_10275 [Candidatus Epulonipiscium fishelsonii]|uniref:Uncharacterized protein n=1 Tax=Candidatus Epulonipiscium fishelsonii TaxID=77094 RepID=A0ACC8XBX3_9FIRM|nr:hypothetical protein AN396_01005 [Epulopiscium sp. SCG-B11WGA-EpuloA1]ONI43566.1 hypothetical protein AN639_10275 [Epulopiscium sp. SCG-B05WGA-EpuloA1]